MPKPLTTGQLASLWSVSPRSIKNWFDSGLLRGYRLPGSKDRRIQVADALALARQWGLPTTGLASATVLRSVLYVGNDFAACRAILGHAYDLTIADSLYLAGLVCCQRHFDALILDQSFAGQETEPIIRLVRREWVTLKIACLLNEDANDHSPLALSVDLAQKKPADLGTLLSELFAPPRQVSKRSPRPKVPPVPPRKRRK